MTHIEFVKSLAGDVGARNVDQGCEWLLFLAGI